MQFTVRNERQASIAAGCAALALSHTAAGAVTAAAVRSLTLARMYVHARLQWFAITLVIMELLVGALEEYVAHV